VTRALLAGDDNLVYGISAAFAYAKASADRETKRNPE
jgi:hypothetical protein